MSQLVRVPLAIEGAGPRREVVFAEPLGGRRFVIKSIPAFTYGIAHDDVVELIDEQSGQFSILKRGGQLTIRVFVRGELGHPFVKSLIEMVLAHDGKYEVGRNSEDASRLSLLLITVPVSLGFERIESWLAHPDDVPVEWEYGNVYDINGSPLMWWSESGMQDVE